MKKISIVFLLFLLSITLSLTSCFMNGSNIFARFFDTDRTTANKTFDSLIDAIKNKDKSALTSLFSKNAVEPITDFDTQVTALFDFYEGNVASYDDWAGPYVEHSWEDDQELKVMYSTYDIDTGEQIYRLAIRTVVIDTLSPDNVGIWSLYIIKMEDDPTPNYAYRGDGKDTPGINIGIKN